MRALVIVAHPDDELIWMGGFILQNGAWNFSVISLCRKNDLDRTPKFRKVCKALGISYCDMSDLEDEKLEDVDEKEIVERIDKMLRCREYDFVFTHGLNGEYGHKRHIEVCKAVTNMIKKAKIKCKRLFYFAYRKRKDFCIADSNADKLIKLENSIFLKKKHLITKVYGYPKGGFEEKSCGNIEAFNVVNVK